MRRLSHLFGEVFSRDCSLPGRSDKSGGTTLPFDRGTADCGTQATAPLLHMMIPLCLARHATRVDILHPAALLFMGTALARRTSG